MKTWYRIIKNDLTLIPDCLEYYNEEYIEGKKEIKLFGNIEKASSSIPHIVEHRFIQLQDIEAILEYLNIQYRKTRSDVFQKWFENQKSARSLTARECEKYVDSDSYVNDIAELINDVALIRNLYLSLMKGIDAKSWQIGNITRLRVAGLEDASLN